MKINIVMVAVLFFSSSIQAQNNEQFIELNIQQLKASVDLKQLSSCLGVKEDIILDSFGSTLGYCLDKYGDSEGVELLNQCTDNQYKKLMGIGLSDFGKCAKPKS